MKLLRALIPLFALVGLVQTVAPAQAHAQDPVAAVCDATVVAGTPVHCTVTAQPGFVPSDPRITWRNPRTLKTSNIANYTVIPVTFDGTVWVYTYVPSLSEVGRFEVFSVSAGCSRLGCTTGASAGFAVTS